MCIGQQYIQAENNIYALKNKKREVEKAIKEQETIKLSLKDQMVEEFLESGVCYDDLGLHIRKVSPKPIITDPDRIPENFMKVKKEIDKTKINAAFKLGESVDGVTLDNGGYTIMFKAKG